MELLLVFCGVAIVACGIGVLVSVGWTVWDFCHPKPMRVRRRLSPILGPDGKPLIVRE